MPGLESTGTPWLLLNVTFCCAFSLWANCANAQISPDGTLPNNSSVTLNGSTFNITGGTQAGSNLFHSFGEFSVPTSIRVFFDNTPNIQNIFSRVTGGKVSSIDGLIQANGNANLFLLNPNGIVFGQNARLNIGGSFIGSTASGLKFADGAQFLIAGNQTPLLTISVPIGLQFNTANPGAITVNGSNLAVPTRQTIALVGGDVNISGARISAGGSPFLLVQGTPVATTPGGRIELGSVTQGEVSLTPSRLGFNLSYVNVPNKGNIQIRGATNVDVSGIGGGEIQINARNLLMSEQAGVGSITQGSQPGGDININATESVELVGTGDFTQTLQSLTTSDNLLDTRFTRLYNGTFGAGNAGNLTINTGRLIARNNTGVILGNRGLGNSGNLTINASGGVELTSSVLTTGVGAGGKGNGGNLTINTSRFLLQDNGQANTTTLSTGKGGDLIVNADSVELIRSVPIIINPFLAASTNLSTSSVGDGDAGNLTLNTRTLVMRDRAGIFAGTTNGNGQGGNITLNASESVELTGGQTAFFPGISYIGTNTNISTISTTVAQAGELRVTTPRLLVQQGAQMTVSTFGAGQGGTVKIDAKSVEVTGASPDGGISQSTISASNRGIFGRGTGGDISISADKLIVRDRGRVNAESLINGNAGNIEITAPQILLDRDGTLTAATVGERGNITLNSNSIIMRRGSSITTNATANNVIGGNITINTDVLAGFENSSISANSADGRGGNINISTQGLFGLQVRPQQQTNLTSNITATGKTSELQGNVQINKGLDPTRGLTQLPFTLTDYSNQIRAGCPAQTDARFIITGWGGLPENPKATRLGQVVLNDFRATANDSVTSKRENNEFGIKNEQLPIVEAQSWILNKQGNVELVANIHSSRSSWNNQIDCTGLKS
ncbi:hypothetical protein NIES2101_31710 [Calothrix sp. HK-06]|nr:hypothetical protein NIES2101_31710 [Calothrix sp. HK-06]